MFDADDDESDFEVGYKKPPRQHRFKPGNKAAAGKRGEKNAQGVLSMIRRVMKERVAVTIDGKRVRMSRQEAIIRHMIYDSKKSNKDVLRLLELIMTSPQESMDEVTPQKITVEFVSSRPQGLPGAPASERERNKWGDP